MHLPRPSRRARIPLLLAGLLLLLAPAVLAAGNTMTMDDLSLAIMPEYDAMNVIVVSSGTLVNDTGRPFQDKLTWLMPKGGEVFMLCETENGMSCQPYATDTSDPEYDVITWRPSRVIQPGEKFPVMFEYTMNNFTAPGIRKFTVPFRPSLLVKNLSVEFKKPKNATDLVLDPASNRTVADEEGFTGYLYSYNSVQPFSTLKFNVSYVRNDTKPSKIVANNDNPAATSGGNKSDTLTALLFAVLAATLGLVLFYALRGSSGKPKKPSGGKSGARKQVAAVSDKPAHKAVDPKVKEEKRKIRKLLVDGKISEETYRQMMVDLDDEE